MKRFLTATLMFFLVVTALYASDPTSTDYTFAECDGSARPYPDVKPTACPDSLVPLMINHVGRHGARFPSSDRNLTTLSAALDRAAAQNTITPLGRGLRELCRRVNAGVAGRWGALDSLGMSEQAGIATRMAATWPSLFEGGNVEAISSYAPRCIMSMYCFTHQLARVNNHLEINTASGRRFSPLLRPFDSDADYRDYRDSRVWEAPLQELTSKLPARTVLEKILGRDYAWPSDSETSVIAMAEYSVIAQAAAMGIDSQPEKYFSREEYNAFWSVENLRHYLQYSSSTLTTATAEMAAPLLREIIDSTDAIARGADGARVMLRFGHAETLMPLFALMHLPGCYYMTNYFDTVALHWRDFNIVPMAANLQLILLKNRNDGRLYLRVDLNEKPVPLIPGRSAIYTPWEAAREYLTRCLPLILQ